jgi:hypothetical protein
MMTISKMVGNNCHKRASEWLGVEIIENGVEKP